jgi:hypothetical protein
MLRTTSTKKINIKQYVNPDQAFFHGKYLVLFKFGKLPILVPNSDQTFIEIDALSSHSSSPAAGVFDAAIPLTINVKINGFDLAAATRLRNSTSIGQDKIFCDDVRILKVIHNQLYGIFFLKEYNYYLVVLFEFDKDTICYSVNKSIEACVKCIDSTEIILDFGYNPKQKIFVIASSSNLYAAPKGQGGIKATQLSLQNIKTNFHNSHISTILAADCDSYFNFCSSSIFLIFKLADRLMLGQIFIYVNGNEIRFICFDDLKLAEILATPFQETQPCQIVSFVFSSQPCIAVLHAGLVTVVKLNTLKFCDASILQVSDVLQLPYTNVEKITAYRYCYLLLETREKCLLYDMNKQLLLNCYPVSSKKISTLQIVPNQSPVVLLPVTEHCLSWLRLPVDHELYKSTEICLATPKFNYKICTLNTANVLSVLLFDDRTNSTDWVTAIAYNNRLIIQTAKQGEKLLKTFDAPIVKLLVANAICDNKDIKIFMVITAHGQFISYFIQADAITLFSQEQLFKASEQVIVINDFLVGNHAYLQVITQTGRWLMFRLTDKFSGRVWLRYQAVSLKSLAIETATHVVVQQHHVNTFNQLLALNKSSTCELYSISKSGAVVQLFLPHGHEGEVELVQLSYDSTWLVLVNTQNQLLIYNVRNLKNITLNQQIELDRKICFMSFTQTNYLLLVLDDGLLYYVPLLKLSLAILLIEHQQQPINVGIDVAAINAVPRGVNYDNLHRFTVINRAGQCLMFYADMVLQSSFDEPSTATPVTAAVLSHTHRHSPADAATTAPQLWQLDTVSSIQLPRRLIKHSAVAPVVETNIAASASQRLPATPDIVWNNHNKHFPARPATTGTYRYQQQCLPFEQAQQLRIQRVINQQGIATHDFIFWDAELIPGCNKLQYQHFTALAAEGRMAATAQGTTGIKYVNSEIYVLKTKHADMGDLRAVSELVEEAEVDDQVYRLFKLYWAGSHREMNRLYQMGP